MTRYLMISLVLSAVFAGTAAGDTAEKDIEWLFVQNAQAVTLEDDVLPLTPVSVAGEARRTTRRTVRRVAL